jgi:HSP20 family protein
MMYFEFQPQPRQGTTWTPNIDVCERSSEIIIFVEMPGVERSDVQLCWVDGTLVISGLKRQHPHHGIATYFCVERAYGHFRREITINVPVDYKLAKAELKDGLMRIYLPKQTSKPEATNIPIL